MTLNDYWIDKYEVSNRQFRDFVRAGGYLTSRNPKLSLRERGGWASASLNI